MPVKNTNSYYSKQRVKDIRSIKKLRKEFELQEHIEVNRECLKCGKKFTSKWKGNRLCTICRKTVNSNSSGGFDEYLLGKIR